MSELNLNGKTLKSIKSKDGMHMVIFYQVTETMYESDLDPYIDTNRKVTRSTEKGSVAFYYKNNGKTGSHMQYIRDFNTEALPKETVNELYKELKSCTSSEQFYEVKRKFRRYSL